MENHEFSKIEVATALRNAYLTIEYCLSEEGKHCNFFDGYTYVLSKEKNPRTFNNFDTSFVIFTYYLLFKQFISTYEDGQYGLLNDIIDIPGIIYVEPKPNNISNKKLIKYFRNAFSHNDNSEHELYRFIQKDGNFYLEINLLKLGPLHILLDFKTFCNMITEINKNKKMFIQKLINVDEDSINYDNCISKLSNAKIRQYESKKDFEYNKKVELFNLLLNKKKTKTEIISKYSDYFDVKELDLSLGQKNKIKEELLKFDKYGVDYDFNYILSTIQPSAKNKYFQIEKLLDIIIYSALEGNRSYSKSLLILCGKDNYLDSNCNLFGLLDREYLISIARAIYCGYIFDTLVLDDHIKIGDKVYDRKRIRNSFTHMRWIDRKNSYRLFDWEDNRRENDSDKIFVKFDDLMNACDYYYQNKLQESGSLKYTNNDDILFIASEKFVRVGIKINNNFIYSILRKDAVEIDSEIYICNKNGTRNASLDESLDYLNCILEYRDDETKEDFIRNIAYLIGKNTYRYIVDYPTDGDVNKKVK